MEFVPVLHPPAVNIEEGETVVVTMRLSQRTVNHKPTGDWILIIEWPDKPKATKIVRL